MWKTSRHCRHCTKLADSTQVNSASHRSDCSEVKSKKQAEKDNNNKLNGGCEWGKATSDKGLEKITDYRQNEEKITD